MNVYDSTKPSKFITYLEPTLTGTIFYGWGLSKYLPYGGFKSLKNIDGFDMMSVIEKGSTGYFLEVDRESPDELHELHNDYPLAPEKLAVSIDMLSKYCK